MHEVLPRWRALEGDDEARFTLYVSQDEAGRRALLVECCDTERWALLAVIVARGGVAPGQAHALAGARALGRRAEPLWLLLWRELGGLAQDRGLDDALLGALSGRGLAILSAAPNPPWPLAALLDRAALQAPLPAPEPGPLDALWDEAPLWSLEAQLALEQPERALLDDALIRAAVAALGQAAAAVRGPRALGLLAWLERWLAHSEVSWQPVLEQSWALSPMSPELVARIWARQRELIERGAAPRWLGSELARDASRMPGREALLLGLPWSLARLYTALQAEPPKPHEYVWLVNMPPSGLDPEIERAVGRVISGLHQRSQSLALASLLAAVPARSARWAAPLWLELGARPESVVTYELCRLFERLQLKEARPWLEELLAELTDLRLLSAVLAALAQVGDTRSQEAIRSVSRRHGALAEEAERALMAIHQRERGVAQVEAALVPDRAPRALATHGELVWSKLGPGPRDVSLSARQVHRLWRDPDSPSLWLSVISATPLLLLLLGGVWMYIPIPWQLAWVLENILGAALLLGPLIALHVFSRVIMPVGRAELDVLREGVPLQGLIRQHGEALVVSFHDAEGRDRLLPLRRVDHARVTPGQHVQLLYLDALGQQRVALTPALASDPYGKLIAAPSTHSTHWPLVAWSLLSWTLLAFMGLISWLLLAV